MKKLFVLLVAVMLTLALLSCGQSETVGTSESTQSTQPTTEVNNDQKPDDGNKTPAHENGLVWNTVTSSVACYPQIEAGSYYGSDFKGTTKPGAYYRVIESYEEFCTLTANGRNFPEALFESSVVIVLHRYMGSRDIGIIGYGGFEQEGEGASLVLYAWDSDMHLVDAVEWKETVYLQIPKKDYNPSSTVVGGEINLIRKSTKILDKTEINAQATDIEPGSAYLIDAADLKEFLQEHTVSENLEELNWMRYSSYSLYNYQILVMCYENEGYEHIFYGNLSLDGNRLFIERFNYSNQKSQRRVIEFVAIPDAVFSGNERITELTVIQKEHISNTLVPNSTVTETVKIETSTKIEYYDFLDLGIYYYDDWFEGNRGYHIISSYDELKYFVEDYEKIDPTFFNTTYVVALKVGGYVPKYSYGIRNIGFNDNGNLVVTMDHDGSDRVIYENNRVFQDEYCYIAIPKRELSFSSSRSWGTGLSVIANNYQHRSGHVTYTYAPLNGYKVKENSTWLITNAYENKDFMLATGIDLTFRLEGYYNKALFVYYGKAGYNTVFNNFITEATNIYIDMSYVAETSESEPKFYVVQIDKSSIKCMSDNVTAHIFVYEQKKASWRDLPEIMEKPSLESFYADGYNNYKIYKEPEFVYQIITNEEEYSQIISEYTTFSVVPSVDFEKHFLVAYYAVEGCTGCPGSVVFSNARYANNRLFIDKYYKGHGGGEAETPTLYFIAVERTLDPGTVTDVQIVYKENYVFPNEEWTEIESEYLTNIFTVHSLCEVPEFSFQLITNAQDLEDFYKKYTGYGVPTQFSEIDFEGMCVLALYFTEGGSGTVLGGFKDMKAVNGTIYITKYYPQFESDGELDYVSDNLVYPVLHIIAIEKAFDPQEITNVVVFKEENPDKIG